MDDEQVERLREGFVYCDGHIYHSGPKMGLRSEFMDKPVGSYNPRGYLLAGINKKKLYVHRIIWMLLKGPIPEGYHVHHIDGNRLNNDINNLECLSPDEHKRKHN